MRLPIALLALAVGAFASAQDLGNIMFVGNSYAESHPSETLTFDGGYRHVIEGIFEDAGYAFDFVGRNDGMSEGMDHPWHNGYGGKYLSDVMNGMEYFGTRGSIHDWMTDLNPNIVVVDLGRGEDGSSALEFRDQFAPLLDAIYEKNANAVVIFNEQVDPNLDMFGFEDEHLDNVNNGLRMLSQEYSDKGYNVSVAPSMADWNWHTDIDIDGVHASSAGYTKMGNVLASEIVAHSKPVPEPGLLMAIAPAAFFLRRRKKA
jgi:hypothetical protein